MLAPELFNGLVQLCAHEAHGHNAYLLGKTSKHGFAAYYPVAVLAKTPIAFLVLAILGTGVALAHKGRRDWRVLAPPIAATMIVVTCMLGRINIGLRHVLPIFPLLAIPAAAGWWWLARKRWGGAVSAAVLGAWLVVVPVAARDDALAYFNEIAAPRAASILLDSDLDWGQHLFDVEAELRSRGVSDVWMAYFGSIHLCRHSLPHVRWLRPQERITGWVVLSQMYRQGVAAFQHKGEDACGDPETIEPVDPTPEDYAWLDAYEPVARVGRSVLIYDVKARG